MAVYKNQAGQKIAVYAYDTSAGAAKTGDAANITAQISKDGGASAATNDVNPTELDATNHPGIYLFDMTAAETNADLIILTAKSTTPNINIEPVIINTTPGSNTAIDAAVTDKTGFSLAADQSAVTIGTVNALGATAKADVNAEVDSALNTAIPASPTADSINERIKALDDNYTAARAGNLDNLDAAVTTRSSHSAADVWSVASRTLTAFSFTVDINMGQSLPATPIAGTTGQALKDADTYLDATISSRGDATAANQTTITDHLTDIKGATWSASTDSLEAIRDRGDAAWTTATGFSTHSAADVWTNATRTLTDKTGFALTTAEHNSIADATLSRNVSTVEATAPEHSLCTTVLAMLESAVSGTTWTIKRTDGTTTHATKTVTTDAAADPITGVS